MSQLNRGPYQIGITLEEARAEHYASLAAFEQAHSVEARGEEGRSAEDVRNVELAHAALEQHASSATQRAATANATIADENSANRNLPYVEASELLPTLQDRAAGRVPSVIQAEAANHSSNPGQDSIGTYGTHQTPVASHARESRPPSNYRSPYSTDEPTRLYTGEPSSNYKSPYSTDEPARLYTSEPSSNYKSPYSTDESAGLYMGEHSGIPRRQMEAARPSRRKNRPGLAGTHPSLYASNSRNLMNSDAHFDPQIQSHSPVPHAHQSRTFMNSDAQFDPQSRNNSPVSHNRQSEMFLDSDANVESQRRRHLPVPNYGGPGYFPDPYQTVNTAPSKPAKIHNVVGHYDSDGIFVASSLPRRFSTDYVSPYSKGSVRYVGAKGYPHGPSHEKVGELIPGRAVSIVGHPLDGEPARHHSANPWIEQSTGSLDVNAEPSFATPPSKMIGSNIYRNPDDIGTSNAPNSANEYLDPNQYLAFLNSKSQESYMNSDEQMSSEQEYSGQVYSEEADDNPSMDRGSVFPDLSCNQMTTPPPNDNDDMYFNEETASYEQMTQPPLMNQGPMFRNQVVDSYETRAPDMSTAENPRKRKNGTLYNESGRLPLPLEYYTEYMNGLREMNGSLATPELMHTPCTDCASQGLICRRLKREGDHGRVFVHMRKPWKAQQVSNYIVCANCWVAGRPQTCSFWTPKLIKSALPRCKVKAE